MSYIIYSLSTLYITKRNVTNIFVCYKVQKEPFFFQHPVKATVWQSSVFTQSSEIKYEFFMSPTTWNNLRIRSRQVVALGRGMLKHDLNVGKTHPKKTTTKKKKIHKDFFNIKWHEPLSARGEGGGREVSRP